MGNIISNKNKEYINKNWSQLKCSPIGPFLQSSGLAPGDPKETSNQCQSSSFSSQFNSSMTDQFKATNKLNEGMGMLGGTIDKIRGMLATIQQQTFKDLAKVADIIFGIYMKIGNIIMVINKNLINIMKRFVDLVNVGNAVAILLVSMLNLLRPPINGLIALQNFFCFEKNTLLLLKNGKSVKMKDLKLGTILKNGSVVQSVMKIKNVNNEPFYKFQKKNGKNIYVTGSHYILNKNINKYVMVKDHPDAILTNKKDDELSCLITSDHKIIIDDYVFWDWTDELIQQ